MSEVHHFFREPSHMLHTSRFRLELSGSFVALLLLIFVHVRLFLASCICNLISPFQVGQLNTSTVPHGIAMVSRCHMSSVGPKF